MNTTLRVNCMLAVGMLVLGFATRGGGQEEPPEATAPPAVEPLREQTVYVPYGKLRDVFEQHGRGVFVPYEEFQKLWTAARRATASPERPKPPVGAILTEIDSRARIADDVVLVTADLTIELLSEGWHLVPLRLADASIRAARLGDDPARIVPAEGGGYSLLIQRSGNAPQVVRLSLEYAKAYEKSPGANRVTIQTPQAPVNRWEIRVPERGVKVDVQPFVAATRPPPAGGADADETVVQVFVGAAPAVQFEWTPKAEGATGLAALLSVQSEQEVQIREGVVRSRVRLNYSVSRAALSRLEIDVPADFKVSGVFDPNVRQWEVNAEGDGQRINVQLFEPARDQQAVAVELEKFLAEEDLGEIRVPAVRAVGVSRQQGLVVVAVDPALRVEPGERTGLSQLDRTSLPPSLSQQSWTLAYRYATLPYALSLKVTRVEPRIRVDEVVEAFLQPDELTLLLFAAYEIERAGVFQLQLDLPAGFEVRRVQGREAAGAQAAVVDTHHVEGDPPTRLVVNLSSRALGRVGLLVELRRRLDDPNLLNPTGQAAEVPLPLPRVSRAGLAAAAGRLILYVPESLRVNLARQEGAQAIGISEAQQGVQSAREGRAPGSRELLALRYGRDDVDLALSVERRRPQVVARQLLSVRFDAGVATFRATFFFDVKYSGVKSLRIDLPAAIADRVRNETRGIREEVIEPAPDDVRQGDTAWRLSGESEFLGQVRIDLAWEDQMAQLDVGKSVDVVLPILTPREVERAWGQIVLAKAETLDVRASGEPVGLRPIDPQRDLMPGATAGDAAGAFEFHDAWSLQVTVTRYQLEEVKRTSIERALLRMVVVRNDQVDVQALYRMRSVRQRLPVQFPDIVDPQSSFDAQPLRINGRPVTLERGDQDEYFIPLVGLPADQPFLVELRYTVPGSQARLDFPVFPTEPAVQKVYLSAYLPEERLLVGYRGPWTDTPGGRPLPWVERPAEPLPSDAELLSWVSEAVSISSTAHETFHTGGRRHLFSTLRPAAPPDGSLRLSAWSEMGLRALVFLAFGAVGLALLLRPLRDKIVVAGLFLAGVVLSGAFLPTFARQVFDASFFFAAAVVLLLWITAALVRLAPRWLSRRTSTPASPFQPRQLAAAGGGDVAVDGDSAESLEEDDVRRDPSEGGPSDA